MHIDIQRGNWPENCLIFKCGIVGRIWKMDIHKRPLVIQIDTHSFGRAQDFPKHRNSNGKRKLLNTQLTTNAETVCVLCRKLYCLRLNAFDHVWNARNLTSNILRTTLNDCWLCTTITVVTMNLKRIHLCLGFYRCVFSSNIFMRITPKHEYSFNHLPTYPMS